MPLTLANHRAFTSSTHTYKNDQTAGDAVQHPLRTYLVALTLITEEAEKPAKVQRVEGSPARRAPTHGSAQTNAGVQSSSPTSVGGLRVLA